MIQKALALGVLMATVISQSVYADLVLWNKLGSESEVLNSEVGANGVLVGTQHAFEPAQFDNGYVRKAKVGEPHVEFPASVIHNLSNQGTIELWINPKTTNPVPFQHGTYALVGALVSGPTAPINRGNVYLFWGDGVTGRGLFGGVRFDDALAETPSEPTQFVATIGEPFHAAISWDIDGIDDTNDRVRVYRDGQIVGSTTTSWNPDGTLLEDRFWLGEGPDSGGFDKFISDNLKVWDFAKTDFSDRFIEGFTSWIATTSGDWDTDTNWLNTTLPGPDDNTVIAPATSLTVTGPNNNVTVGSLTVGGGNGIATLALNGGELSSTNDVLIQSTGVLTGDGVVNGDVINHGTVAADNVTITGSFTNHSLINGSGRINATLNNTATGEVRVGSGDHLLFTAANNTNAGQIEVIGGELEFTHSLVNAADTGRILARDATLRFKGGLTNANEVAISFGTTDVFGDIDNQADGQIDIQGDTDVTFWDDVINNGSISVDATSQAVFFGDTSGSGSFPGLGLVVINGTFSPGNSPGEATFGGDLTLGGSAALVVELAGLDGGVDHDRLTGAGTFTANGELTITLIDGFQPRVGDAFQLFDFDSIEGDFLDISLPTFDDGRLFDTSQLISRGQLFVVPEPTTATLLGLAVFGFAAKRRGV